MRTLRRLIRRMCDERGAAIVEFALVAPILLALVWGIIETGRAFYTINSLASAVRDGARWGAANCPHVPSGSPGTPAIDACRDSIKAIVTAAFQPIGVPLVGDSVRVLAPFPGTSLARIEVTASYPYEPIVPIGGWKFAIERRAVFRYERLP